MSDILYTTHALLKKKHACRARHRHLWLALRKADPAHTKHTKIPLATILKLNGFGDCCWAEQAVPPKQRAGAQRVFRLFAADCAEQVLPIFEKDRPNDKRPRQAIEATRKFALDQATEKELAAARDAAWAAERAWQIEQLKKHLKGDLT